MNGNRHLFGGIAGGAGGRVLALAATALVVAACGGRQEPERASVEYKGTNPTVSGTAGAAPSAQSAAPSRVAGGTGIVSYDGYQAAVAREGDTVADVAQRIGLSATELGAYNGLPADHPLRAGDELVLPPKPGGYGTGGTQVAQAEMPAMTGSVESSAIEAAPIESAPIGGQATGGPSQWSLASAEAAIDRAAGFDEQGNPGAPPSANSPLPPDPQRPGELASPQLDQYQTPQSGQQAETAAQQPQPRPVEDISTPAEEPVEATAPAPQQTQVATATPAAPSTLRLIRPVSGPVVVGYQQGSGRSRNDGIDFAAAVGSPVVAAADGEVALVSQSLGGLGTIVLVRHPGDYLTVYGRIDRVAVAKGDIVAQGQTIGVVASNPQPRMHFEVRKGAESLNPERFFSGSS